MTPRPAREAALLALGLVGCAAVRPDAVRPDTESYLLRLKPGQDPKAEVEKLAHDKHLQAASVVSAVGRLTEVALRLANQEQATRYTGHFEVVALSGYLADGECHLHMAVSDGDGKTLGGHVMDGSRVYTTLVVVIQEHLHYRYRRELDASTGKAEPVIDPR